MKVDFHCHSTASDGTLEPREIASAAISGGYRALALTDHDNMDGVEELLASAGSPATALLAGVELSIYPGVGFDRFHLLGLGVDPDLGGIKLHTPNWMPTSKCEADLLIKGKRIKFIYRKTGGKRRYVIDGAENFVTYDPILRTGTVYIGNCVVHDGMKIEVFD